jgi:hypothetical protein
VTLHWQRFEVTGSLEIGERTEASALSDNPGDPLGDPRILLPGTYEVLFSLGAASVVENPGPGGIGSFGGRYYVVETGEPVVVRSDLGHFTPSEQAS